MMALHDAKPLTLVKPPHILKGKSNIKCIVYYMTANLLFLLVV